MLSETFLKNINCFMNLFETVVKMAFLQIPHSECPEKNSKDPPL